LLAVFIPLIVAVVVTGVYIQRGRVRRFAEIKAEMGQNLGLAEQAGDDMALVREHYNTVVSLATEAEELRLGDEEVERLRRQALSQLDRLDDVTRLNAEAFYEYPETADLATVVLREGFNGGLYTLDKGTGRVYQHQTDETYLNPTGDEPEQVIFSGEAVGNHVADEIVDIVWRPRGRAVSREGLAALDVSGTIFTFYPNFADKRAVPLGLASEWQLPVAMTTFDERLYVLDVGARAIWKYFPEDDGFLVRESERTVVFSQNPDLEDAVDFDIYSEDGSLIVLYGDGRIRYYDTRSGRIQWDENQLLQIALNTPLFTPATLKLVGRGLNASIFVADPGSNRIVQISRGGIVLAQYRASDEEGRELFSQISDFAIAEAPLRVFVTAGNTLFVATQE
jgi:hypothetical protein